MQPTAVLSGRNAVNRSKSSGAAAHMKTEPRRLRRGRERVRVSTPKDDVAVMDHGYRFEVGASEDPDLAVQSCKVTNDWLARWCAAVLRSTRGGRIVALQGPEEAAADDGHRRIAQTGAEGRFAAPKRAVTYDRRA